MRTLICGSFAYDNIMVFGDRFKNHILPDQVHILNVCFLVPEMRREFGGCAGNIAYGLKLLGGQPLPMATVGQDFAPYRQWMESCGIDGTYVTEVDNTLTAQAYITTDLDDNQITAFHPGAMGFAHRNAIDEVADVALGIVSPDGREGMIEHAAQFAAADIPFIFDPGQGLPMFSGEELSNFIDQATWVTVNDYEWQLLQEKTGLCVAEITERVEALIVTRGAKGSVIYSNGDEYLIPTVTPGEVNDPTGCGDAYRAGLIYGLNQGFDWETTGRIASLMGSIKIEHNGTQNHQFTLDEFRQRYETEFGSSF
ncbi:sugar kinase [Syntrophotalea acetylenivorans]|uniref:Sugar kinase n=1 Tax=Syntrophotalea acetylenivorans TaxID=1842532 RepID=A0A1L3GT94_9BACT|nr:carbohydrate kinase family protein [Syntrophotalea acetylenivorans]APG28888.1 sugar kinase [Syntrophotalea acetylenivorans]